MSQMLKCRRAGSNATAAQPSNPPFVEGAWAAQRSLLFVNKNKNVGAALPDSVPGPSLHGVKLDCILHSPELRSGFVWDCDLVPIFFVLL
ncbi:hypothetical protein QC761_0042180 [Podospora bellae-mahoneyi]|uniref:Uncharacterized protein n=1 Tax=Podospora bellae-mahoneyi TaxID=2093777 RepID=A0ABR0FTD7_9PEZI|nr:hypothetical protein QC761_0042180 [Podospora bellae-mahoneyi]